MATLNMNCVKCGRQTIYSQEGPMSFKGGMPKIICQKCAATLREFNSFKELERYYIGKAHGLDQSQIVVHSQEVQYG